MSTEGKENVISRVQAFAVALLLHGALIAFLVLFVLKTPIPPFPEAPSPGIEVNFGNFDEGTGTVENNRTGDVSQPTPTATNDAVSASSKNANTEKLVTSVNEESVSLTENTSTQNSNSSTTENTQNNANQIQTPIASNELMNALSQFRNRTKSQGGGDGNSGKAGNEGSPDGNPFSDGNGTGGNGVGVGNGIRFNLKGRNLITKPVIIDDSQDQGKVVVDIIVNSKGEVVKAEPGVRGSTTASPILYAKARQAAFSTKFNPTSDGTSEQRGSITFTFVLD